MIGEAGLPPIVHCASPSYVLACAGTRTSHSGWTSRASTRAVPTENVTSVPNAEAVASTHACASSRGVNVDDSVEGSVSAEDVGIGIEVPGDDAQLTNPVDAKRMKMVATYRALLGGLMPHTISMPFPRRCPLFGLQTRRTQCDI